MSHMISRTQLARMIGSGVRQVCVTSLLGALCLTSSFGADRDPQVVKALGYTPRQSNVVFDKVSEDEIDNCTGQYETRNGLEGLVIYGPNGQPLRRFADSNNDRQVDQWCYYKDGIEVYRDIDSDFNGAADEYRWLGTGGTRWGLDKNEDGKIDQWKSISPEEVTIEVVEALKTRDEDRFKKLLISDAEMKQLGLSDEKGDQLTERVVNARKGFGEFARSQKLIDSKTKWAHFAADKPGVVPAGTDGAAVDIVAYENAIAIVENEATSQQLMIGTLIQIDGTWRLADLPRLISDGSTLSDSGFFFPAAASQRLTASGANDGGLSQEVQKLLADLERIENKLKEETDDRAALHDEKASVLQQLVVANKSNDQMELWVKQFADSISSAAQSGEYPEGVDRLRELESQLGSLPKGKELIPYVAYRLIGTEYTLQSTGEKVDFARLQSDYMEKLEAFAQAYPNSSDTAEAMLQIGLNHELSGDEREAEKWYKQVSTKFPTTNQGKKASGAIARLSLEGRQIGLVGKTLDGKNFDSKTLAGSPILVHYWASWCGPCKADMAEMRKIQATYARQNLQIVGVNLDTDSRAAIDFLNSSKSFPWPHLHEQGGFESDLAIRLGVLSVPVTILIDGDGRVVKRTSHFSKDMMDALEEVMAKPGAKPAAVQTPKQQQPPTQTTPKKPDARKAQQPNPPKGGVPSPRPR